MFGLAGLLVSCKAYEPNLLRPPDARDASVAPPDAEIDASMQDATAGDATADDAAAGDAAAGDASAVTCVGQWEDCNGNADDGCETPLGTLENCSACGVSCATENAVATCAAGACKVATCASGWEDCDHDGTSCETQLGTLADCSGCGVKCELSNALASCDGDRHCTVAACQQPYYADCDGGSSNGCEVDKRSDARNCGQCGNDCAAHAHLANASCSDSACSYTCGQGFADCNGAPGCETPLNTNSDCGACGVPCLTSCVSGTCAPNLGWEKRITINGAEVALTPTQVFTNFPVLIRLTDPNLRSRAATDGSDIYFVAADATSRLDHEIEAYDSVIGALVAWVRIPSLAPTDTVLYLRYGDGGADRSSPNVWGPSFKSVWHLAQDPSPGGADDIKDSASSAAHATALPNMDSADFVNAVIGRGCDFDGIDDELSFTNTLTGSGPHTISAWVNQRTTTASNTVISFGASAMNQGRFLFSAQGASSTFMAGFFGNDLDGAYSIEGAGWRYVVWTWSGATNGDTSYLYVDGVVRHGPVVLAGANTLGTLGKIGSAYWAGRNLNGQLDEVRVATAARGQPWITTEYNNQRPNSTFIKSVGAEQPVPN